MTVAELGYNTGGEMRLVDEHGVTNTPVARLPPFQPKTWRGKGKWDQDWGEAYHRRGIPRLFVMDLASWEVEAVPGEGLFTVSLSLFLSFCLSVCS